MILSGMSGKDRPTAYRITIGADQFMASAEPIEVPTPAPARASSRFACRICGTAMRKGWLSSHVLMAHPKLKCTKCNQTISAVHLVEHMQGHEGSPPNAAGSGFKPGEPARALTSCSVCQVTVRCDRVQTHMAKVHPSAAKTSLVDMQLTKKSGALLSRAPTQREFLPCPRCGLRFSPAQLRIHSQTHERRGMRGPEATTHVIQRRLEALTKVSCPKCQRRVPNGQLDAHLAMTHAIRPTLRLNTGGDSRTSDGGKLAVEGSAYPSEQERDEAEDGSSGYHVFRENGRFGSLPSFDAYGDEPEA